jgi:hypothetical protein
VLFIICIDLCGMMERQVQEKAMLRRRHRNVHEYTHFCYVLHSPPAFPFHLLLPHLSLSFPPYPTNLPYIYLTIPHTPSSTPHGHVVLMVNAPTASIYAGDRTPRSQEPSRVSGSFRVAGSSLAMFSLFYFFAWLNWGGWDADKTNGDGRMRSMYF